MILPDLPIEGGCRCGAVRFRVTAAPILTLACHCLGCQKMTGAAFSTSVGIPTGGFAVIAGETVTGGLRNPDLQHHHCDACKSWLFTRIVPDPGFVNVRATMLDDARWWAPFVETCTDAALPWVTTPARHRFPGFPPMETWGDLVAEFQARVSA